jgi:VWFA-related protein
MMPRRRVPVAVLAACVASATVTSGQTPVFRTRQDTVRLDVLVSDRGRPVTGLTTADFVVRDNGVTQKVSFVGFDEVPINLVLTFDVSGSVTGRRLEDLRAAGHAALDQLRAGDRAAVVSFTHAVVPGGALSSDLKPVRALLDAPARAGQTSLVDASFAGLVSGATDSGRSLMLVFTDGVDTASWLEPPALIEAAKLGDVVVFGVSAGRLRAPIVRTLAETTGGELFEVRSTDELRATFVRLVNEYRQRYLVAYSPTGVESRGWHRVEVSVSRRGASVKARPGYLRR